MAGDKLAALYASDGELIAFTALDSEDVGENLHGSLEEELSGKVPKEIG